ncbi:MAG: glutathione S-transferase [Gammaproteobacteria bacterium]
MADVKLTYFRGRGRAETTRWMLAAAGVTFVNVAIDTPEELAVLRSSGKLPFDQIPLLEIDGLCLSQSSAMTRYLARRSGLCGSNDIDAMWCDIVAGVVADFAEAAMQAAFQPTKEVAIATLQSQFEKFGPKFEARLAENGTGFCAGAHLTFADVVLAEALSAYLDWVPDILGGIPLLIALHENVLSAPGIAHYLHSPQRYPMAENDYVIDVASVLQRALPSHMPDPNRFVPAR